MADLQLKPPVHHAEYRRMLASAVAHPVVPVTNPRDVVVAIVGGTMLTLALTRPRLRWVERLTEDLSPSVRGPNGA